MLCLYQFLRKKFDKTKANLIWRLVIWRKVLIYSKNLESQEEG